MKMLDTRPILMLMVAVMAIVAWSPGQSVPAVSTKPANEIRLEHIGEEWDAYGNFLPVLRLTNYSRRDISYAGYSTSSPVYMQQVRGSDREEWREHNPGWCGTGLGTQQLRAGQSATFRVVPREAVQSWRIGIKIDGPEARAIWTQPINREAAVAHEAPSAAELVQVHVSKHPDREYPYTFTLKNVSGKPLFYGGYQEPHVPPIYLNQEKRPEGWHDDGKADWSGTGFGFKRAPARRVDFILYPRTEPRRDLEDRHSFVQDCPTGFSRRRLQPCVVGAVAAAK